jgi:hypothetical protein
MHQRQLLRCRRNLQTANLSRAKQSSSMKRQLISGLSLVGVWLVLYGLIALLKFSFQGLDLLMGALAIAAGALLLMNK